MSFLSGAVGISGCRVRHSFGVVPPDQSRSWRNHMSGFGVVPPDQSRSWRNHMSSSSLLDSSVAAVSSSDMDWSIGFVSPITAGWKTWKEILFEKRGKNATYVELHVYLQLQKLVLSVLHHRSLTDFPGFILWQNCTKKIYSVQNTQRQKDAERHQVIKWHKKVYDSVLRLKFEVVGHL